MCLAGPTPEPLPGWATSSALQALLSYSSATHWESVLFAWNHPWYRQTTKYADDPGTCGQMGHRVEAHIVTIINILGHHPLICSYVNSLPFSSDSKDLQVDQHTRLGSTLARKQERTLMISQINIWKNL